MIKKTFQFGRISLICVIFYKPCFVQSNYREQLNLDNHLSAISCLFGSVLYLSVPKSAPTIVWVARSRGLPRSTGWVSPAASSLWHFQGYLSIAEALACFPAVTPKSTLAYVFAKHEHYRHHSLCEHGLSSA